MSYITRIMYWIDLGADGAVPQGPTPFRQLRKNIKEKEKRSRKEKRTRNDQMMGAREQMDKYTNKTSKIVKIHGSSKVRVRL